MTITTGTRVGHFVIDAPLGAGGLGVVYLAEDESLKRKVALKFLTSSTVPDPTAVRRLVREAQIAGRIVAGGQARDGGKTGGISIWCGLSG